MMIDIEGITLLVHTGSTDRCIIKTRMPTPYFSTGDDDPLHLSFETQAGYGLAYLKECFTGYPVTVIDKSTGTRSFHEAI